MIFAQFAGIPAGILRTQGYIEHDAYSKPNKHL